MCFYRLWSDENTVKNSVKLSRAVAAIQNPSDFLLKSSKFRQSCKISWVYLYIVYLYIVSNVHLPQDKWVAAWMGE